MGIVIPNLAEPLAATFPELSAEDPADLVAAVRKGIPADRFDALRDLLDVSTAELAEVVNITPSTLSRRRNRGVFDADESERILRLAHIVLRAVEALDGRENARKWLVEPSRALGGEAPLHFADTEPGAREVERLLLRLEYGVYS